MGWLCQNCSQPWSSKVQDSASKVTGRRLHTARPKALAFLAVTSCLCPCKSLTLEHLLQKECFQKRNYPRPSLQTPSSLSSLSRIICPLPLVRGNPSAYEGQRAVSLLPQSSWNKVIYDIHLPLGPEVCNILFQSNDGNIADTPSITLRSTRSIYRTGTLVHVPAQSGYQGMFVEFQVPSKVLLNFFL